MNNKLIKLSGMLGFIIGVLALITGYVYPARTLMNAFIACLSFVLLLVFFIFHFESFRAFSRKRSTQFGLNSIMMVVLFIFIAVVINLIARQFYARMDMSSTSKYSLAPQTVDVVRNLGSEVRIIVFGREGSQSFTRAVELLEGYRYLNRNVVYSVVDLDREPLLAKEYGVSQYDSVVVRAEGAPMTAIGIGEETLTNAIIRATRKKKEKIYFIRGHGERDIQDTGRGGMSKALQKLASIGYEVSQHTLSSAAEVPKDADLLIIAGPSQMFSPDDIQKVREYINGGGRILAMFDPGYDSFDITSITGMKVLNAEVIDSSSNLGGRDEKVPLVSSYPDTPVTRDFRLTTVFPGVAPIETGGLEMAYDYLNIVITSPGSRVVENGRVSSGSEGYVIAASAGTRQGRDVVMVYGDSDFASNAFFDVVGNGNLFMNSVNWVAEEGQLVSVVPRKDDFVPLYLTPEQGRGVLYTAVAIIPFSILGSGMFIWWRRSRL